MDEMRTSSRRPRVWDVEEGETLVSSRATAVERMLGVIPLPYSVACLLLAVLIGPVGQFIAIYLDAWNLSEAASASLRLSYFRILPTPSLDIILAHVIWIVFIFYMAYVTRLMRLRLVAAERRLRELVPKESKSLEYAFRPTNYRWPVALLGVMYFVLSFPYILVPLESQAGLFFAAFQVASYVVGAVPFGSFVWMYFSPLLGLHRLGRARLEFKSYTEDKILGARPAGSLSLALAYSYLGLIVVTSIGISMNPDPNGIMMTAVFGVLGVAMFFLPLRSFHIVMLNEKRKEEALLRQQFVRLAGEGLGNTDRFEEATLTDLKNVLVLEMAERRVATISTWPIDTRILGRLLVIVTSVTTVILARLVLLAIGL